MSTQTLPPPLFDLDPADLVPRTKTPRSKPENTLPPPLFEPAKGITITLEPFDQPFIPYGDRRCGGCRKFLRNLPTSHCCGGARDGGHFDLCDYCAADDVTTDGLPRWGITRTYLQMERARRRVYANGGGETEVMAEFERTGLTARWRAERAERDRIRAARETAP